MAAATVAQVQPPPEIEMPGGLKMPRREPLPVTTVTGLLRRVDAKSAVVEPDDKRLITVFFDAKSKFDRASIQPGDTVSVTATVKDGAWTAVEIRLVESGNGKSRERAAQPLPPDVFAGETVPPKAPEKPAETLPEKPADKPASATTTLPPDTEERPRLRRGRPTTIPEPAVVAPRASLPEPKLEPRKNDPKPDPRPLAGGDPFLDRAREAAANYTATLPNFVAKQITTRYEREPRGDFQPKDQVECEVLVENGIEHYRDFKKHGRSIKKPEGEGTWTAGEFRSLLEMVLGNSAAVFFNRAKETIARRETVRYQFSVPKEASNWRVVNTSQLYLPAYSGTIWLDAESARVLRIEMESRGIPEGFPISKVETTLDYDFVTLAGQKHLLPVSAAALACEAQSKICSKNEIQFRGYRAFTAESKILFDESK